MSERAAFINAILDNPADDTARLVFADWLQENGEPERAEFIREQIAGKDPVAPSAWRKALGFPESEGQYVRGFLTDLEVYSNEAVAVAGRVLAVEPATFCLRLDAFHEDESPVTVEDVSSLASNRLLRAVTKIWRQDYGFGVERFVRLMKSPHLINLRAIEIFEDPIGVKGVRAIAKAPAAFVLEVLGLNEALDDDDEGKDAVVKLLATAPRFASLKRLSLMFNYLNDDHVETLLASKTLPRTLHLELEENDYDEERFEEELAERFTGGSDGKSEDE